MGGSSIRMPLLRRIRGEEMKVIWHLMFFDPESDALVADITVTEEQARGIWLATGNPTDLDPMMGEYPVKAFLGASGGG
jgi:hypothetical protein